MANALAALKGLACPAGDNCTAFQCLFSHPCDKRVGHNAASSSDTISTIPAAPCGRSSEGDKDPRDQELQRKRRKLDIESTATTIQHSSSPTSPNKLQPGKQRKDTPVKTLTTAQQQHGSTRVSNSSNQSPGTITQPATGEKTNAPPSIASPSPLQAHPINVASTAQPISANKEPESLNPRLLKKAPASHPTRVALVKALHGEFRRLNEELRRTAQNEERKLLLSDQELIVKTLDEEQEVATKKTAIYNTSIRSKILMYKKMSPAQWKEERSKSVLGAGSEDAKSASVEPAVSLETGLTQSQEVQFLRRLVYDLSGLGRHGYVSEIPSQEDVEAAVASVKASGNTEKCDRCTRRFQVFPGRRESDGALSSNGPCIYHPGRPYFPQRAPGDRSKGQRRYKCCQRNYEDEAGGCTTAQHHVFKTTDPKRLAAVLNFVATPTNPNVPKDRAVSFDCEMGYTVHGLELVRLTVVSWPTGELLLDILTQPVGEILDLNTRFSGVRAEDIALAERCVVGSDHRPTLVPAQDPTQKPESRLKIAASPKIARDLLFTIISAETPLIGHGLENDLNAIRIVHPTCIDTVLLFPHSRGLPMRNGLKYLMETKLGRKIQVDPTEGSPEGHDSAEDARAAGDLVRLQVRDEWKSLQMKGWIVDANGDLEAPTENWTLVGGARVKKRNAD